MSFSADIICLLDDEPCVLKALGRLLASEGLCVEKFSEPKEFLEHARIYPVRLAVIDLRMPGMSGLEVLEELSTISPGVRAIVMTGETDPEHGAAAKEAGASAFFRKPFDGEAFLAAVRDALAAA